jgi:hypothetical protein
MKLTNALVAATVAATVLVTTLVSAPAGAVVPDPGPAHPAVVESKWVYCAPNQRVHLVVQSPVGSVISVRTYEYAMAIGFFWEMKFIDFTHEDPAVESVPSEYANSEVVLIEVIGVPHYNDQGLQSAPLIGTKTDCEK